MGFFQRIGMGMRRFMMGRYGSDQLNMTMLVTALVIYIVSLFIKNATASAVMMAVYMILMFYCIFRMMSRNTYKRYQENRRFLHFFVKLKDRQHRYYSCPRCRQQVRVPRKKGRIAITCPKCKERFVKKT